MGIYTTPTQLAFAQKQRFMSVIHNQAEVHRRLAHAGLEDFLEATDGPLKKNILRAMGHPYGRGAGGIGRGVTKKKLGSSLKGQVSRNGAIRPLPINVQTGNLRRSIRLTGPRGSTNEYRLAAYAKHARFVLAVNGTRRMIARGLLGPNGHLRKRHKARVAVLVAEVRQRQKAKSV